LIIGGRGVLGWCVIARGKAGECHTDA
jgi:hypothetical protein